MKHHCLVCNYPHLSEPPRSEYGGGSFEICPACGFQFGVNDDDEGISYDKWRDDWEKKGMPWCSSIKRPDSWNPVARAAKPVARVVKKTATLAKKSTKSAAAKKTAKKATK
jgi:hypothetical protein